MQQKTQHLHTQFELHCYSSWLPDRPASGYPSETGDNDLQTKICESSLHVHKDIWQFRML